MEMPTLIPTGALGGTEAYCVDKASEWYGWLFRKDFDGAWVSWRETGPNEREAVEKEIRRIVNVFA